MLQIKPQEEVLLPQSCVPEEAVKYISEYIKNNHCENISIDISYMNVIDACHVTTLCSATHFIKYPSGKIHWKISSELVSEFNKDFELGNSCYNL